MSGTQTEQTIWLTSDIIDLMRTNYRDERQFLGLSARDISDRTGINMFTVLEYENGKIKYGRLDVWLLMSEALGHKGLDWLMRRR